MPDQVLRVHPTSCPFDRVCLFLLATLAVSGFASCGGSGDPAVPVSESKKQVKEAVTFVGGEVCASCHEAEAERWRGSHHDLAMQEASETTVLGDFDGAALTHFGTTSRFFRRGSRFFINTDGPDGELHDYEVAYTFGVEPLQQYLVAFPGGRLQAFGVAWDARPVADGGQRWFHLYPEEPVPHDDVLHWTGPAQRWNFMCAECHSTHVEKRYDPERDGYETTWSEIDVSCESCHGPGSRHAAWAEAAASGGEAAKGLLVDLRNDSEWILDEGAAIARRAEPRRSNAELDTCAPCHSRRSRISPDTEHGRSFLDTYRPALLDEGLYHADGQILDEVYVWGSFLQSRMHAAGVTCSDCHDPHAVSIQGNPDAVCARCHRPEVFAAPDHHHHRPGTAGASCVACHMPERTYMVVDPRRDHGFRVPRPDLAVKIGVPDACTGCHVDETPAWSAEAILRWYGKDRTEGRHWGEVIDAGRRLLPGAGEALAELAGELRQPAMVRATALWLLRDTAWNGAPAAMERGTQDEDPLVRMAAAEATEALPPALRLRLTRPLLDDPVRAVRIEAARVLAGVPPQLWRPGQRGPLADALMEYRAAQEANADRPEAHLSLGSLHAQFGELDAARQEYETALRLGPSFVPSYVNLADVARMQGRDDEGEALLRRALSLAPDNADVHHALGLLLVRQKRMDDALDALRRAAELNPRAARYAYVYGVALHSSGQTRRALALLEEAQRRHPDDIEIRQFLAELAGADE